MHLIRFFIAMVAASMVLHAGPYAPAAGQAGSTAISKDNAAIIAWAAGYWQPQYGANVDSSWKTPNKALGKAKGDSYDIVCLGDNGSIVMWFPYPICDGDGVDFAVFENSFSATFLELAFVEVSSDGVNFHRFPSASLTASAVGGFGSVDPTNIDGLASKYQQGYGTPFDLAALPTAPDLDKQNIRFVRLVDIVGNGTAKDSSNRTIYDPHPTTGSAGFDLDAIGVIHQNTGPLPTLPPVMANGTFHFNWGSNPGRSYRIESSENLTDWTLVETVVAPANAGVTSWSTPLPAVAGKFWRAALITP